MPAADLSREARLRRAADFAALRQVGARCGGRCFHIRYRANDLGAARLGLAISKRVSKQAVERNRIKRLLRESFRRRRHELPAVDLVVMARDVAAYRPGRELLDEIELIWRKLCAAH